MINNLYGINQQHTYGTQPDSRRQIYMQRAPMKVGEGQVINFFQYRGLDPGLTHWEST